MRRYFIWASLIFAVLVLVGIVLQLYFIASYLFGEAGALTAHKRTGDIVHAMEILSFLSALVGWWGNWRNVAWSFAFAVVGTAQAFAAGNLNSPSNGWLHGLHGGLVLFVVALAATSSSASRKRWGCATGRPRYRPDADA